MLTEGIDEQMEAAQPVWFVRLKCRGCGFRVGALVPPDQAALLVDRLVWTDDARHRLERMPPYIQALVRPEVEEFARSVGQKVVTLAFLVRARNRSDVVWAPEAERRLERIPAPVRALARLELERTAAERGQPVVTVALMEEVKARYFGFFKGSAEP